MSTFLRCAALAVICLALCSTDAYAGWTTTQSSSQLRSLQGQAMDPPGTWVTAVCTPMVGLAYTNVVVAPTAVDTYAAHPSASCDGFRSRTTTWSTGGPHWSEYHFEYLVRVSYLTSTTVTAPPEIGPGGAHASIVGSVYFAQNYEEVSQTVYLTNIQRLVPGTGIQTGSSDLEDGTITWNPVEAGVYSKTFVIGLEYIEISDSTPCLGPWAMIRKTGYAEAGADLDQGSADPGVETSARGMGQIGMSPDTVTGLAAILN